MVKYFFVLPLALLLIFSGCATVNVYNANPSFETADNEYFDLLLEPQPAAGYHYFNAFRFVLTNKTDRPLSFAWEETYYLFNGRKYGQFGWQGMTFEKLKEIRRNPYAEVKAGDTLTAVVFPLKMLARLSLEERARLGGSRPEDQFAMGLDFTNQCD